MKKFKISFCITCMNRLHHLITTLPQNIDDNKDYPNLEFVLLNYNSQDEMETWVNTNMATYISSGLVKYYRTPDPAFFLRSHSKNMALRLATGDILCNINADHFIGKNFAEYVNEVFNRDPQVVITCDDFFKTKPDYKVAADVLGKVCVKREDFNQVSGFDEKFINYGFEDIDFINRLELSGLKRSFIEDPSFLKFISHSIDERFSLKDLVNNVHASYFHYITPTETQILVLYKDHSYKSGTFIDSSAVDSDNPQFSYLIRDIYFEITMKEVNCEEGTWKDSGDYLVFPTECLTKGRVNDFDTLFSETLNKTFYRITDPNIIQDMENFMHLYPGMAIMEQNLRNKKIVVNKEFGNGRVYKNFDSEKLIYL